MKKTVGNVTRKATIEFAKILVRIFIGIFYKVKLIGRENIPKSGSVILCANHIGGLDMFLIGYRIRRIVHWMAKEELFRVPFFSVILRWFGAFPVKRNSGDIGAIKTSINLLKNGHVLGIFPGGTRAGNVEENASYAKGGVALIAIKSQTQILPVAIKRELKLFGKAEIIFGSPYKIDIECTKKCSSEELNEISHNIMHKIYELMR